jgi:hypothetical protein
MSLSDIQLSSVARGSECSGVPSAWSGTRLQQSSKAEDTRLKPNGTVTSKSLFSALFRRPTYTNVGINDLNSGIHSPFRVASVLSMGGPSAADP